MEISRLLLKTNYSHTIPTQVSHALLKRRKKKKKKKNNDGRQRFGNQRLFGGDKTGAKEARKKFS